MIMTCECGSAGAARNEAELPHAVLEFDPDPLHPTDSAIVIALFRNHADYAVVEPDLVRYAATNDIAVASRWFDEPEAVAQELRDVMAEDA
jgi:hypothetical protein